MEPEESSPQTKIDPVEKAAGASLEEAVKAGIKKELSDLADELDRDAVAKERMYRDIGSKEVGEREAWGLRDVSGRIRQRIELIKL